MNIKELERDKRYSIFLAERLIKENFSYRGWSSQYAFVRHKYHAEKINKINKELKQKIQGK